MKPVQALAPKHQWRSTLDFFYLKCPHISAWGWTNWFYVNIKEHIIASLLWDINRYKASLCVSSHSGHTATAAQNLHLETTGSMQLSYSKSKRKEKEENGFEPRSHYCRWDGLRMTDMDRWLKLEYWPLWIETVIVWCSVCFGSMSESPKMWQILFLHQRLIRRKMTDVERWLNPEYWPLELSLSQETVSHFVCVCSGPMSVTPKMWQIR